jgi:prepilin-type processing-associated H-X9-DG protein
VSALYILPTIKKQSEKLISSLKGHYIDPLDFGLDVVAVVAVAALAIPLTLDNFSTVYFVDGHVQLY